MEPTTLPTEVYCLGRLTAMTKSPLATAYDKSRFERRRRTCCLQHTIQLWRRNPTYAACSVDA